MSNTRIRYIVFQRRKQSQTAAFPLEVLNGCAKTKESRKSKPCTRSAAPVEYTYPPSRRSKGPKFGTWSQMGPKCQNGPKKVPILLPSPKFLILPSDDAEKGRHIAVSHCCVLFGHTQCIMCMSLILSSPIIFTDR